MSHKRKFFNSRLGLSWAVHRDMLEGDYAKIVCL